MVRDGSHIVVNTRILSGNLTGVQRYLTALLKYMPVEIERIAPSRAAHGIRGHIWEQLILPARVKGALLWSPSNTGPLAVGRQVVTVHDLVPFDHPEFLNPRFARWYRVLLPKLVRRVRRIITGSEFTKHRLVEVLKVPESRISVIRNGVDARFRPQSKERIAEARRKLGLPNGRYLVTLGSLEPRKNLKRLLEAWSRTVSELPDDVMLVIAGAKGKPMVFDGVSLDLLPPRVHLTGHVPDELLPALYSGAIAAPYLSVYEGFGLPPLEAMACGVPVLTGNRTALPEVVGDAAVMVDPYDVDAIADSITTLVNDAALRADLVRRGQERAARFTWQRAAEKTLEVLQEAVS